MGGGAAIDTVIAIVNRRSSRARIEQAYPGRTIIDATSNASMPYRKLSPFYPHGEIPVPFSPGVTAQSVEGIWQGLKVFRDAGVDPSKFEVTSMKGLKRTVKKFGPPLGHAAGVNCQTLFGYVEARKQIYLPSYRWVLEHRLQPEVAALRLLLQKTPLVLLDYETNCDVEDASRPLSHASLVAAYVLNA